MDAPAQTQPHGQGEGPVLRLSVVIAALVAALVGFGGTVPLVLSAAAVLGATSAQTASWVAAVCLGAAGSTLYLSLRHRMPIVTAWSTPGAALIAGFGAGIGMQAAVGAFLLAAVLVMLCAAIRPLGRLVARIPVSVAAAMLAGVLARFVMAVADHAAASPALVLPLLALFFLVRLFSPSWAVLAVLVAGGAGVFAFGLNTPLTGGWEMPQLTLVWPVFDPAVMLGLGVPLFLVSMAAQNLPGFAVLRASGYQPPTGSILAATGLASLILAPVGSHSVTLSAITAAICTGKDAHPDPAKRFLTGPFYALFYFLLAGFGATMVAVFAALPPALIATIAGLALLSPLTGALTAALAEEKGRIAAVATFTTTVSGVSAFGLGAPVWGLLAGLLLLLLDHLRAKL
ncbi:benzoate/H(+) symporter BenE family transporter [Roseixanthobacter liquoris]|uniref:benzoate/H(+) symporter BenE family transporter n=1 Tax=Roseixanthobacter liquoris TaxID=3119921 RepID=UPI00372751B1